MVHRAKLTAEQIKAIHANHGTSGGGIRLFDIKSGEKVEVMKPEFLAHKHLIIARGFHPKEGHRIAQIVKTT